MNIFSKTLLVAALPAAVSAQGLYSIAPNDDEAADSLPLTYTVGASVGYDDNPNPLAASNDESTYASAFVQANWTSVSPQTTWDVFARLGVRHYFESFDGPDNFAGSDDETTFNATVGVNLTQRVNERLRFSSRNLLSYETEPDYSYGIGSSVRAGNYFRYASQNSIGYRWSDRFGTQTGVDFQGVIYDDIDDADYDKITFRQSGRYRISPATVLTAEYRYSMTDSDQGGDSDSHYLLGGVEHRFSPVSALVLRAGAQFVEPDNGDDYTTPFVEAALRTQLTEQLGLNTFVRYSAEEYNRALFGLNALGLGDRNVYEENETLRVGARANYAVNQSLSFFAGINYVMASYENEISDGSSADEDILNANLGFSYEFVESLFLTGSYNYTDSSSDLDGRDYDRNRFELGVQTTF